MMEIFETTDGGFYGQLLDTDGRERTDPRLNSSTIRDITSQQPECDRGLRILLMKVLFLMKKIKFSVINRTRQYTLH